MNKNWMMKMPVGSAIVSLSVLAIYLPLRPSAAAPTPGPLVEEEPANAGNASGHGEQVDPVLLEKIRPLYPEIRLQRGDGGEAFFSSVEEVARVRLEDGRERLVVWVHLIIPAARVDHGRGELLIFADAEDALPLVRRATFTLPVIYGSEMHLVEDRWLRFGEAGPLVSLVDEDSLRHFGDHGLGSLMMGLSVCAAKDVLMVYLEQGREAFLKRAPIRKHREHHVRLPDRIRRAEIYPSLVEEMRPSGFKYFDTWEATLLVRLTPADKRQPPVVLEIGTKGLTGGIECEDVELLLWETRQDEPSDRPSRPVDMEPVDILPSSDEVTAKGWGRG